MLSGASSGDGAWDSLGRTFHSSLATALENNDLASVSTILAGMFCNASTTGLALGEGALRSTKRNPYWVALDWHDKVLSLGVALGILPAENPEQGQFGSLLSRDSIDILRRCEKVLGFSPIPPQVGGIFGVNYKEQAIPVNQILHLYSTHRIFQLSRSEPLECLEIGGGVGLLAHNLALKKAKRVTILDLAIVNVMQGYVLLNSSVADSVRLFGETKSFSDKSVIEILPDFCLNTLDENSFNIVVNQDSLPEMSAQTMTAYLERIPELCRDYFLSVNQEAQAASGDNTQQGWVFKACQRNPSYTLNYRMPYWLRKGYTEELWSFGSDRSRDI